MRTLEKDLKTSDTQPRETPGAGREHTDATQRARKRGEHAASAASTTPRRQGRRRAAHSGERRPGADGHRSNADSGFLSENSLDPFLRAARAHSLLPAEAEV